MSRTLQLMVGCDGPRECSAQGHGNGYTFFHSRWLIQINPMETVTESTVLTSWCLSAVLISPSGVLDGQCFHLLKSSLQTGD